MPPADRPVRARFVALGCLLVVWIAFVYPLFAGLVHFPTDFQSLFFGAPGSTPRITSNQVDSDAYLAEYPWHVYLGRELAAGHLPLWDPSRFAGVPFAADISVGTFYPPNWLYALGAPTVVASLIWAGTILASLLLAYWFLTLLRLHPFAAALGAVVWTFSGFMVSEGMFGALLGSAVWLPMALAGLELARRGRWRLGVPVAGLALALAIVAGHTQIGLYVWIAAAIWAVGSTAVDARTARRCSGRAVVRELARSAGVAAGVFAIAGGLASIQLLGTLEYAGQIIRQRETVASASYLHVAPRDLVTLLIPDYHGSSLSGNYRGLLALSIETTIYAGVLTLPLALAGALHRNRRLAVCFGLLTLVGLTAAMGTPVFHALFALVPGVARTRDVTRFKLLLDAGLAGMAALGVDAVLGRRNRAARWTAIAASAALVAALVVLTLTRVGTRLPASYLTSRGVRAIVLTAAGLLLLVAITRLRAAPWVGGFALLAVVSVDLWMFGFGYHPFQPNGTMYPASSDVQRLASMPGDRPRFAMAGDYALPPNAAMVFGLHSVNGYDPFIPATLAGLLTAVQPDVLAWAAYGNKVPPLQLGRTEPPILDLLGVRRVVTPPGVTSPGTQDVTSAGRVSIFDQPGAFPAAFVATCWEVISDAVVLPRLAAMTAADLRSTVTVVPGAGVPGASPATCPAGPAATLRADAPEHVVVSVPPSGGGVAVLADQWYPGWTATLDGRDVPILRVDAALRGVVIGPGPHRIDFRYRPRWPLQGLATVALTLAAIMLVATAPPGRWAGVSPPRGEAGR
jgi:hypothetical protein